MRLGVLDVGSNTVHLLVVDARPGAEPTPQISRKSVLRLAENLDRQGNLSIEGADALVGACADARAQARELDVDELLCFATSAVRDASNSAAVLDRVRDEAGIELRTLSGADEARLTFLAVRRWFGWSAGTLLCFDIGGGSLEVAAGPHEDASVALSVPLGAGRLTRERLTADPPARGEVSALRKYVEDELGAVAKQVAAGLGDTDRPDRVVATSKTFRTLARLAGAAPSGAGPRVSRVLTRTGLGQITAFISRIPSADLGRLDGVSPERAHQLVAGAVVAAAAMDVLDVDRVEICPWALREGIILRRIDRLPTP